MTLQVMIWSKRWTICWIPLKSPTKRILLFLQNHWIIPFLKRVDILQLDHHRVSLIKKIKKDVISVQPSNYYIAILFLDNLYSTLIAIPWWLVLIKATNNFSNITKISWLWKSYRIFWWYIFRSEENHYYLSILHYWKYKGILSDGCSLIWGVIIYYLIRINPQESENSYDRRKLWLYYIWLFFSAFWYYNCRNNDISVL